MHDPLHIQLARLASDRWARRGVRLLLRGLWLGLALACCLLGAVLLFDMPLRWEWLAVLVLTCLAGAALLLLRPPLKPVLVARRLDRRFNLHEQLATALELDSTPVGVAAHLRAQADQNVAQIVRFVEHQRSFPWSEVALTTTLALLLGGMLLLIGVAPPLPLGSAQPLPPLALPPDPQTQPPPPDPLVEQPATAPGSAPSMPDPAVMQALADALRDQSLTRPAAEALDRGDLETAARQLRELADQAGQIGQSARNDLGNALRRAANRIEAGNPDLANQLRQQADGLQSGRDDQAAQALEALADMIEDLAQADQAQQDGMPQAGGAGDSAFPGAQRAQESPRLGVDGVPLELATEGDGSTPAQANAESEAESVGNGGSLSQGDPQLSSDPVQSGDDPLRIPADLRDVVQDYFSP
ncbi:hypothetical protein [Candidatus Oscillochloris fontis]|uniref:hypothetical protein n=1 Tax=Candidatus Oscillochloris fontis TaxID=2496868 RepID=UPI00101C8102|nr:hypothetical protein [Candidatus Oscillochloris fontis]